MKRIAFAAVLVALAGCVGRFDVDERYNSTAGTAMNPSIPDPYAPPLDPKRKVSRQDCSRAVEIASGNLMCREVTEAELRARIAEEERQARARKEAAERAERERLERERAALLAKEEAARKARAAEEERLAAERRRQEEEAARKAREARELEERKAAEALALARAEQEAREAAERERQRLEQEWLEGRALLEKFVGTYGKVEKFRQVSGQINTFLDKTR
jgi:flagellar biosynthesis GTPase FlhF